MYKNNSALPNWFYDASVTIIPKPEEDIEKKEEENYRSYS